MSYTQGTCNGGVCKQVLVEAADTGPFVIDGNEAASFDTVVENLPAQASGVRVVVFSNRPDVRVVAQIINRTTGEVVAFYIEIGKLS